MFAQLASFNLIRSIDDTLLGNGGKEPKRCVIIISEKFQVYYLTHTKNARAFYYSFKSMFDRASQTYGSQRLRDLINESDFEDWQFFFGKAVDIPYFKQMQGIGHYEELVNCRATSAQSAVINCGIWTVRENETGLVRVIFSALPIDLREVLIRFKRSLLTLQRLHREIATPTLKKVLGRAYENAVNASIVENYEGFTITKHTAPLEFCTISSISRTTNEEYFRPWAGMCT